MHERPGEVSGYVGTNNKVAQFQMAKIPPRSFLAAAAMQSEEEIHRMLEKMVIGALSREGHEWREVLHLFKEIGHDVRELFDDIVDEDDDDEQPKK